MLPMNPALFAAAVVCLLAACAGNQVDSVAPACTGVSYDVCTTEHDCLNELCFNFDDIGRVCTIPCTAGDNAPCTIDGKAGTCSDQSGAPFCKPSAPTTCTHSLSDAGM